ncbi:MAG: hypothetical protein Q8L91_08340, partial [Polaromonas sp.]|nr:hypothetical protein [Polaromonas sp.]
MLARGRLLHRLSSENWFGLLTGLHLFTRGSDRLFNIAGRLTARLETASLQRYIAWMLIATVAVAAVPLLSGEAPGTGSR